MGKALAVLTLCLLACVARKHGGRWHDRTRVGCQMICRCHNLTATCSWRRLEKPVQLPQGTYRLLLDHNRIETLSERDLILPDLQYLDLRFNRLRAIERDAFQWLRSLRSLLLDDNRLEWLAFDLFAALPHLEHLSLAGNALDLDVLNRSLALASGLVFLNIRDSNISVPNAVPGSIAAMSNLRTLELGYNEALHYLSPETVAPFVELPLEALDISSCGLRNITPDSLTPLTTLRQLDVSYCSQLDASQIGNLFLALGNVSSIAALHLAHVMIDPEASNLPSDAFYPLHNTSSLETLDLEGNIGAFTEATIYSEYFRNTRSLKTLDLSSCLIRRISEHAFRFLDDLLTLNLADNVLSCRPRCPFLGANASRLLNLRHLDLSNNVITSATFNSATFPSLRVLLLRDNRLTTLTACTFGGLMQLQSLDLSGNPIEQLPPGSFGQLSSLRSLFIQRSHRLVQLVNGSLSGLSSLRHLSLSRNALRQLDTHLFSELRLLHTLELNSNELRHLRLSLPNLRRLDVTNNRLQVLSVDGCRRLSHLHAQYNHLQRWALSGAQLRFVDMAHNAMNEIPSLSTLPGLQRLNVIGNPLECTCSLKPFVDWLAHAPITLQHDQVHVCSGPTALRGYPLRHFHPSGWDCRFGSVIVPLISALSGSLLLSLLALLSCKLLCAPVKCPDMAVDSVTDVRRLPAWIDELRPVPPPDFHHGELEDPLLDSALEAET